MTTLYLFISDVGSKPPPATAVEPGKEERTKVDTEQEEAEVCMEQGKDSTSVVSEVESGVVLKTNTPTHMYSTGTQAIL